MDRKCRLCYRLLILILALLCPLVSAEASENYLDDLLKLPFEDLVNVEIVSASKKIETVFNSPLSASVLTKAEFQTAGVTSIMEALRLMPGIIVREVTNGNYDIHIRGLGNIPQNSLFSTSTNSSSLVMIDNRIVYNYLNGGTFWESLPIDLNDVERIELVRGPAAALYGPNAVSGVINIITREIEDPGFYSNANLQTGNYGMLLGNGSIGYKSKNVGIIASGNYQKRDRFQTSYYQTDRGRYVDIPDSVSQLIIGQRWYDFRARYPDPSSAMDKFGINTFFDYHYRDDLDIAFSAGYQEAKAQNIYVDTGGLPITAAEYNSYYTDLKINSHGFAGSFDRHIGERTHTGASLATIPGTKTNIGLEYSLAGEKLSFRPGIEYQQVEYDWVLIGGIQKLTTLGYSLQADYDTDRYRLIGAIRGDSYNHPDEKYFSFQLCAMYKINSDNIIRAAYSRANRAPFMASLYFDFVFEGPGPNVPDDVKYGNTDLKLMTMDMVEVGYRSKISDACQIDAEIFYAQTRDYCDLYENGEVYIGLGGKQTAIEQHQNIDVRARQLGATVSANILPVSNLQIRPYFTLQSTDLFDYAPDLLANPDSTVDISHEHDPSFFGGLIVNFRPVTRINANINVYLYGKQTHDYRDFTVTRPYPPPGTSTQYLRNVEIEAKILFNAKISYDVARGTRLYLTARNLAGADAYEFAYSDRVETLFLCGINYNY